MRRSALLLFFLVGVIGFSFVGSPFQRVKTVYDGDTILLEKGRKVRYLGINAPEMGYDPGEGPEFMAREARDLNARLVAEKRIRLEFDKVKEDRHGRILAYVFLESGEMVNALMVRRGLAHVSVRRPNLRHFSSLLEQQRLAMREGIGIWMKDPPHPESFYLANAHSFIFHRPACDHAKNISPQRLVRYEARRDALWEGMSPCRECKP